MSFNSLLRREWQLLWSDGWLRAMVTWLPVALFLIMWGIFSAGIARDLPIGVVDLDHSRLSRQLIRNLDASPTIEVSQSFVSVEQGSHALRGADIYALVVIPEHLEKNTLLGYVPEVTTFNNSQFILIAKLVNSAIVQAHGTLNASIDALKKMAGGVTVPVQALGQAVPIRSQITPLYNRNNHYGQFIVSAAVPAIWQIMMVVTTILSLAAEMRRQGLSCWLGDAPVRNLLAKFVPYTCLFWFQGMLFLWFMYGYLGWPMNGSWTILLLAQLLTVIACQGIGALFLLLTLDPTKAMSFAAGFTAPAFAFVGVTFPATDMPAFAQFWRSMLPVTHYLEVQVHQVNHGQSLAVAWPQLAVLCAFILPLLLALWRAAMLAGKHNQEEVLQ
ncbi:ABC-type multidrug transport system, permease component [Photobacterium marinum]|uniref:ABC-type multidrug transport system, permease component n=1 Tax=Photobacterium marinum TaxID=1056511 RepID=L8JHB9_9GAMM|nr:ABC transporter permease [Photobacterium marinum]ELR66822.1 ABC-type multidrug transport system, permease component [Photobacterium marinum]